MKRPAHTPTYVLCTALLFFASCSSMPLPNEILTGVGSRWKSFTKDAGTLFQMETGRWTSVLELPDRVGADASRPLPSLRAARDVIEGELGRLQALPAPLGASQVAGTRLRALSERFFALLDTDPLMGESRRGRRAYDRLLELWAEEQELPALNRASRVKTRH